MILEFLTWIQWTQKMIVLSEPLVHKAKQTDKLNCSLTSEGGLMRNLTVYSMYIQFTSVKP